MRSSSTPSIPGGATPAFPQPIFNEGNITPDPTRFKTYHPDTKSDLPSS